MRTREKSFKDHGFYPGEEKKLKEYCRKVDMIDIRLLLDAAISTNQEIAMELFYSLSKGVSYEKLSNIEYIALSKTDFYGYQRKCLATFRNLLILFGKWEQGGI